MILSVLSGSKRPYLRLSVKSYQILIFARFMRVIKRTNVFGITALKSVVSPRNLGIFRLFLDASKSQIGVVALCV